MAPPYHHSFPSDHLDHLRYSSDHLFFPTTLQASSSSSSSSLSFLDHAHSHDSHQLELKQDQGGGIVQACNHDQTVGNDHLETGIRFTIWKQIDKLSETSSCCENINDSVKWAASSSSKMRFVINSNQTETATTQMIDASRNFQDLNQTSPSPSSSPSDQTNKRSSLNDGGSSAVVIRTCSDCNTTKTPLWRSGPRGPKSLCNACGIRQRKARRAMAAAAANGPINPCGGKPPAAVVLKTNKVQHKIIKPAAANRKCKDVAGGRGGGRKKLCFEDITISKRLSESSSSYQRVFPQDEREAAILLMTLSYGLLHG